MLIRFMKKVVVLICCILLLQSCNAQPAKEVERVAPSVFAEKIKATPNAQIIDVRTPGEFSGEHLDNARNINWNGDDFDRQASKLDKSRPVFVYCKIGGRSADAAQKLAEMGFTKIYDLNGGILKWNADGLAEKSDKIIGIDQKQYDEIVNSDQLVLVDFYADWCAPCRKMSPYLSKMQIEMKDKVTIVKLNADQNKTLVQDMKIETLPALFLYKDNKLIWQHSGYIGEDELKKQL